MVIVGPTCAVALCSAGVEPFSPVYQNTVFAVVPFCKDVAVAKFAGEPGSTPLRRIRTEEIVGRSDGRGRRQRGLRQVRDGASQRCLQIGRGGVCRSADGELAGGGRRRRGGLQREGLAGAVG